MTGNTGTLVFEYEFGNRMKRIKIFSIILLLMLLFTGCNHESTVYPFARKSEMMQIAFWASGASEEILDSKEDHEQIAKWLASFTLGEPIKSSIIPGSNQIGVRIVYEDGKTISNGLSTIEWEGKRYYLTAPDATKVYEKYWVRGLEQLTN